MRIVAILPNKIGGFSRFTNFDAISALEFEILIGSVANEICLLSSESGKEVLGLHQLLPVVVLVVSHLLLDLFNLVEFLGSEC